jgi:hypothetical protein
MRKQSLRRYLKSSPARPPIDCVTDIEYVCTGNRDRSVLAEAITLALFERYNIYGVHVSSSGTRASYINDIRHAPQNILIENFTFLYETGAFLDGEYEKAMLELSQKPNDFVVCEQVMNSLEARVNVRRKRAFSQLGLSRFLIAHKPTQTVARPNAQLVLTMSRRNQERVQEIYAPTPYRPKIETLNELHAPFLTKDETQDTEKIEAIKRAVEWNLYQLYPEAISPSNRKIPIEPDLDI